MVDRTGCKGYVFGMREAQQTPLVREPAPQPDSPAVYLRRAEALIEEMDRLNPWPRPRGFVQCFRTHEDYEVWKRQQTNPRLW